ncbi:MAG TPA: four-helix bundle copper-binding protein [Gemmata sp.]|nr:four-helix bundle copper-binding protein [Gemmata sp.]
MTRILIALFAFGALSALSTTAAAPDDVKFPKDTCVKPCQDCAKECLSAVKHARDANNDLAAKHLELCHHACLTCAIAVEHKNPQAWAACELCEKICNDCATVCEKSQDEHMKKCAEMCRKCAQACQDARK